MKLPTVRGSNLLRQKMIFPQDFSGKLNLVFIAFQRWHQDHIDAWVPIVEELEKQFEGFSYYEFPTLPRSNPVYRTFLNEGMRAGIPDPATRARTITLYLSKPDFRQQLDIPNEADIWTILFDRQGRVLWRTSGPVTAEKAAELRAFVASRLQQVPA